MQNEAAQQHRYVRLGNLACFSSSMPTFTWLLIRYGASDIPIYPPDIPEVYPAWLMPAVLALLDGGLDRDNPRGPRSLRAVR